jgi:integrase
MIRFTSILKDELSDFQALRDASKGRSTRDHDRHLLRSFDEYLCAISCSSKNLTEEQVSGWVCTLSGHTRTTAGKVAVIRLFLKQLSSYGIRSYIPPVPKAHDDYVPYIFSETEMNRIFHFSDSLEKSSKVQKNTLLHMEQPMILRLMYGCGLRIGETLSLRMQDVDLDTGVLVLRCTKGDKQRTVPMHQSLAEILARYCMAMGIIGYPESYLFPTADPLESVTPNNARHKFDSLIEQAEISLPGRKRSQRGPCLHCLRHVFVFKAFADAEKNGRRIDDAVPYLSIYLGHDSLKETEKYLKFTSELFPDAMELFGRFAAQVLPEVNCDE